MKFSPDGSRLASAGYDQDVHLWNVSTGVEEAILPGQSFVGLIAFDSSGRLLASGDMGGNVAIWDVPTAKRMALFQAHSGHVSSVVFAGDGRQLLTSGGDSTARIWNALTGELELELPARGPWLSRAVFSNDGTLVATASCEDLQRHERGAEYYTELWDARAGACRDVLPCGTEPLLGAAFSPDGLVVVSYGWGPDIAVWNTCDGTLRGMLRGDENLIRAVAFSNDSRRLFSVCNMAARAWDPATGRAIASFEGHEDLVENLRLLRGDALMATASGDSTVRVWDTCTGSCLAVLSPSPLTGLTPWAGTCPLDVDETGTYIASASGDNTVWVWKSVEVASDSGRGGQ